MLTPHRLLYRFTLFVYHKEIKQHSATRTDLFQFNKENSILQFLHQVKRKLHSFRRRRRRRPSLDLFLLVSRGQQTQLHIRLTERH